MLYLCYYMGCGEADVTATLSSEQNAVTLNLRIHLCLFEHLRVVIVPIMTFLLIYVDGKPEMNFELTS